MDAAHLYKTICQSLGGEDQESAVGALKTPLDVVAIVVHVWALHSQWSYEGDDGEFDLHSVKALGDSWQKGSPQFFTFKYLHNGQAVDLTVTKLGSGSAMVNGLCNGIDASTRVEPNTLVRSAFFQRPDGTEEVRDAFASDEAVENVAKKLTRDIARKLFPDEVDDTTKSSSAEHLGIPRDIRDHRHQLRESDSQPGSREMTPNASGPPPPMPAAFRVDHPIHREVPPGFEDDYEILGTSSQEVSRNNTPNPFGYGEQDLFPSGVGRNPPLNPFLGTGPGHPTGGMHPTFDDPLFQQQRRGSRRDGDGLMRPPGARWDPTGPQDNRFNGSDRRFSGSGGFI